VCCWPEDADYLVAHELVDDCVVGYEDVSRDVIEATHQAIEVSRSHLFGERRGPTHVGEEQRALHLGATVAAP
jgi:hypothetical protein